MSLRAKSRTRKINVSTPLDLTKIKLCFEIEAVFARKDTKSQRFLKFL
jgi:hypothetical protein